MLYMSVSVHGAWGCCPAYPAKRSAALGPESQILCFHNRKRWRESQFVSA